MKDRIREIQRRQAAGPSGPAVVSVHRTCDCGHGQNEHLPLVRGESPDEPRILAYGSCEGCVDENPDRAQHEFMVDGIRRQNTAQAHPSVKENET